MKAKFLPNKEYIESCKWHSPYLVHGLSAMDISVKILGLDVTF